MLYKNSIRIYMTLNMRFCDICNASFFFNQSE